MTPNKPLALKVNLVQYDSFINDDDISPLFAGRGNAPRPRQSASHSELLRLSFHAFRNHHLEHAIANLGAHLFFVRRVRQSKTSQKRTACTFRTGVPFQSRSSPRASLALYGEHTSLHRDFDPLSLHAGHISIDEKLVALLLDVHCRCPVARRHRARSYLGGVALEILVKLALNLAQRQQRVIQIVAIVRTSNLNKFTNRRALMSHRRTVR